MNGSTHIMTTAAERTLEEIRETLGDRLEQRFQVVEGGPWDGVHALTRKEYDEAFLSFFGGFVLPEASEHAAEVRTPARVTVVAVCPRCGLPVDASVRLSTELHVKALSSRLKVVTRTEAVDHVCGQTVLPTMPDEGQQGFDLSDIVGGSGSRTDHEEPEDGREDDRREGGDDPDDDTLPGEPDMRKGWRGR